MKCNLCQEQSAYHLCIIAREIKWNCCQGAKAAKQLVGGSRRRRLRCRCRCRWGWGWGCRSLVLATATATGAATDSNRLRGCCAPFGSARQANAIGIAHVHFEGGMWQVSHTHAPNATFSKSNACQKHNNNNNHNIENERDEIKATANGEKATQRQTAKVYKDF